MAYRLTRIYTRTGDEGYTSLGDKRISKDDLLVEAVGSVDELNANIGLIISTLNSQIDIIKCLTEVQQRMLDIGGELHMPEQAKISNEHVEHLEEQLDMWNHTLPPLKEFILPGGNHAAATCHVSRTICRRTERCLVKLHRLVPLSNLHILRYLNRLSDLLFVIARVLARETSINEPMWEH